MPINKKFDIQQQWKKKYKKVVTVAPTEASHQALQILPTSVGSIEMKN